MNFEILEKYKTPKDYFLALDEFKRDPSNIRGGIVLTNPLFCFMNAVDWECGTIINRLKLALDFVKRKSAGENNINDTIISNILRQTNQQISYLLKKIKRGYWGLKWGLLSEIRKVLSSLSSSIFLKITRAPINYVPEEFEFMEKDLKTLNDTHIQHIELKETFGERLKKMSFEEAIKGIFERGVFLQKETGIEFEFQKGQVFFNGKKLRLSAGKTIEILKILFDNHPNTVEYDKLDESSRNSASDQLRGYISTINSILKKNKIPYHVKAIRTFGYALSTKK
jgi:hypothetical protein